MRQGFQFVAVVVAGAVIASCAGDATDTTAEGTTGDPTVEISVPRAAAPADPSKPTMREAIQLVLDGETEVHIDGAPVTYLVSDIDGLKQGFLIQADRTGPALMVSASTYGLVAGDRVSLLVTGTVMGPNEQPIVTQFDDLTVTGRSELFDIIQDASNSEVIVNSGHTFHNEYITVTGTLFGDPQPPPGKPALTRLATDGFYMSSASSAGLFLRFPAALLPELPGLTAGCSVTVVRGYLWHDYHSMCTVMSAEDIAIGDCPSPKVVGGVAPTQTQIMVTFSRPIEPTSVDPAHFVFDVAITALSATVVGRTVVLTTTAHPAERTATVTVANAVTDLATVAVDANANTATFQTWEKAAVLRITEVNSSIMDGESGYCGLIELVVVSAGTTRDFVLRAHAGVSEGLPALSVKMGDVIVVHTGPCNPTGAVTEFFAPDGQPVTEHPQNYDTALDVHFQTLLPLGDLALYLLDPQGEFMDVILTTDDDPTLWSGLLDDVDKIVAADEWVAPGGGTLQGSEYGSGVYETVAVPYDVGMSATGPTIQRATMSDTNTRDDWLSGPSSMGIAPTAP